MFNQRFAFARRLAQAAAAAAGLALPSVTPGSAVDLSGGPIMEGQAQAAVVGTATRMEVAFECEAVADAIDVASTGVLQCYLLGESDGQVYGARPVDFTAGLVSATGASVNVPTQGYLLCYQGQVFFRNNTFGAPTPLTCVQPL
jgi:hypothetical protein